jgi:hypothetical protein
MAAMTRTVLNGTLIVGAFFSTCLLGFASIAEAMGAPSVPVPYSFAVDKIVAILCFVLCCLAIFRARVAGTLVWLIFVPYTIWFFVSNRPSEFLRGVPLYFTTSVFCLSLAAFTEAKASTRTS